MMLNLKYFEEMIFLKKIKNEKFADLAEVAAEETKLNEGAEQEKKGKIEQKKKEEGQGAC